MTGKAKSFLIAGLIFCAVGIIMILTGNGGTLAYCICTIGICCLAMSTRGKGKNDNDSDNDNDKSDDK